MVLSGYVKDNIIFLDDKIQLPDGLKVRVEFPESKMRRRQESSGLCGIWQDERQADEIVEEIMASRTAGRNMAELNLI